jgi:hypothetical protein
MSHRCHAVGHRRPLEGHDPVAALCGPDANQRIAPQHSRDHRTHVDSPSPGTGTRRNSCQAAKEGYSSVCALFDFEVWVDTCASAGGDLRVGTQSSKTLEWRFDRLAPHKIIEPSRKIREFLGSAHRFLRKCAQRSTISNPRAQCARSDSWLSINASEAISRHWYSLAHSSAACINSLPIP